MPVLTDARGWFTLEVPEGWDIVGGGVGVQLVDTALRAEPDSEAVRVGPDDVPTRADPTCRQ